ncbi:hypothetical protein R1sor_008151 [Riccia sorocarpa]|uniref:Glycosyltransferase 61 catalytic domain-containing protein n=1 Tax=Riccia sorocarpa TaxID=122646 RepID=A0ABD3HSI5_9MARC
MRNSITSRRGAPGAQRLNEYGSCAELPIVYDTVTIREKTICHGTSLGSVELLSGSSSSAIPSSNSTPNCSTCTKSHLPTQTTSESSQLRRENAARESNLPQYVSLKEAYFDRMRVVDVSRIKQKVPKEKLRGFKSRFLPNRNFMQYPVLAMENVCMAPSGALLLVGTSDEEIRHNVSGQSAIPELYFLWHEIYNCNGKISTDRCVGVTFSKSLPRSHSYVPGNTAHMLAYFGNPMHNWAERTWPFIMASLDPIRVTVPHPINHYIVHRFEKWLQESHSLPDRAQLLWQFRILMELSGDSSPGFLVVRNQSKPLCFERLLLQMHSRDRIDETRLPIEMAAAGVRKYREAVLSFFRIYEAPQIRLPPGKLRVLYYGRNDTSRRRVRNSAEVVALLRSFRRPPFEVTFLDEMLSSGETNYSFPEVIRLFTQTDILVIAHGANTWPTFLLPEGAAVVEIIGPCNWSASNYSDLTVPHTWMHVNAAACGLKHDFSNPFHRSIPNPLRGNTTQCLDPFDGVPDYTIDLEKLEEIIHSFAYPDRPGDRLTQHWLYDWDSLLPQETEKVAS